tara:strand:+ start:6287 stop:6553 length:267 start_codon:yes stop_codon:yes gene_type:complete
MQQTDATRFTFSVELNTGDYADPNTALTVVVSQASIRQMEKAIKNALNSSELKGAPGITTKQQMPSLRGNKNPCIGLHCERVSCQHHD